MTQSNWYIIKTKSNKEKKVLESIKKESENGKLINKIDGIIVPTKTKKYLKNGKKIKRDIVMYPGYVFIKTSNPDEVKDNLKFIKNTSGFLTSENGKMETVSEENIFNMIGEEKKGENVENEFSINEEVLVIDGPFSSMKGIIDDVKNEKVKLSVSIFGRKTPIELDKLQISKI